MDPRKWFLLQERPLAEHLQTVIENVPCTDYRCPNVMKLFLAGFKTEFKLTDQHGQPTEALRVMVQLMGAQLCQGQDLPTEERWDFTDYNHGTLDPVFKTRWFIRNISDRLAYEGSSTWSYGWAWYMFKTKTNLGLVSKQVSRKNHYDGKRERVYHCLVVCPPDWELNDHVYEGLWKWGYAHHKKIWDSYSFLAARSKGVTCTHGPTEMVPAE